MIFDDHEDAPQADSPPVHDRARRPDDAALRAVVLRLARPHRSGGHVVERAALMAGGTNFTALLGWIESHDGVPEVPASASGARGIGLFGDRGPQHPLRFVLPATAFSSDTTPVPRGTDR